MPRMIDADALMSSLDREVLRLQGEMAGQPGFEALSTASAMLALSRVREAVADAAARTPGSG